ncbi:MAG: HAD hydrolase-like protein [Chthoniobacterales bacterium]
MIRNVILDWSGTVVDDLAPVVKATNLIFKDFGRPEMSLQEFREKFQLPFSKFYAEHLPEATIEGIEPLYHRFFHSLQDEVTLLPGAREFLDFCQATGRRLFLLSTIRKDHFETQATRLDVLRYFEHPYVEIFDKREKIREILKIHALLPQETIFVGDMMHDIETARHGGILGVAVQTGFDPINKLLMANPAVIVENLRALQTLLSHEN